MTVSAEQTTVRLMREARFCISTKNYATALPLLEQAMTSAQEARLSTVAAELFNIYVDVKVLAFG